MTLGVSRYGVADGGVPGVAALRKGKLCNKTTVGLLQSRYQPELSCKGFRCVLPVEGISCLKGRASAALQLAKPANKEGFLRSTTGVVSRHKVLSLESIFYDDSLENRDHKKD